MWLGKWKFDPFSEGVPLEGVATGHALGNNSNLIPSYGTTQKGASFK